jgi:hypothetical protein
VSKYTLDFSGVEVQTPVKPGKYEVLIDSVEQRQSEGSEFPYLNWKLTIVSGEFEGRTLYMMTSFSPKALFRLQAVFQNFGIEAQSLDLDFDDGTGMLLDPSFDGLPAVASVRNEKYQGRMTSRVEDLVPVGETPQVAEAVPAGGDAASPFKGNQQVRRSFK